MKKVEIVTLPRSGTIFMRDIMSLVNISGIAQYDLISNRHLPDAFEKDDQLNIFILRDPIKQLISWGMFREISTEEAATKIIKKNIEFYKAAAQRKNNTIAIDFNSLISKPRDVFRIILTWLGDYTVDADEKVYSHVFMEFLDKMKELNLSSDNINKQNFPREVDQGLRARVTDLIMSNENLKECVDEYLKLRTGILSI